MKSFESARRWTAALLLLGPGLLMGCGERDSPAEGSAPPPPPATQADPPTDPQPRLITLPSNAQGQAALPAHLTDPPPNPRAALIEALSAGLMQAEVSDNQKLRAVLKTAGVPEASQVLVFSKTSLQDRLITPRRPRAIYFNDDCYIGYVPGGLMEYGDADEDPTIGSGFFALDPDAGAQAKLTAEPSCANCHAGSRTNDRPGFLVRSVFPDDQGFPITSAGSTNVGHDTPIEERWGGWYVTGQSGKAHHRGNQTATALPNGDAALDPALGSNITDLSPYFNTDRYLRPTSDIVALMVLEHQVQMHNLLTQGASIVHERLIASQTLAQHLGEPFDPADFDTLQRVIDSQSTKIVKHLLFCDETRLADPIVGGPDFQQAFAANRRADQLGRSLKDFDLQTHLFKYRCSYMVYSRAFGLMPDLLKDAVVMKLRSALAEENNDPAYAHLGLEEREAIRTILLSTTDWFAGGD